MKRQLLSLMIAFLMSATAAFGAPDAGEPVVAPSVANPSLSEIFGASPVAALAESAANGRIDLKGGSETRAACTASASCDDGSTVACSGNSSCNATDSNCSAGVRGQVTCDGATTLCPTCPPQCTFFECRQPCRQPGCIAICLDRVTCECETICQ